MDDRIAAHDPVCQIGAMIRVFYSNHLERLVDSLVDTIRREKARTHRSAFEAVRIIVPNWNLETFLKLQIAERTGLAAALEFERLERFVASLVHRQPTVPRFRHDTAKERLE